MTVPGMPSWAAPPAPPPRPPAARLDPPLVQGQGDGSVLVLPMAWAAGWGQGYAPAGGGAWDDAQQINAAMAGLAVNVDPETASPVQVGTVRLHPSAVYSLQSQVTKPPQVNLDGQGARVNYSGNGGAAIYSHGAQPVNTPAGTYQHNVKAGFVRDLVLDGTGSTGGAYGLDVGDAPHTLDNLLIQNFASAGGAGLAVVNRLFYTEKFTARKIWLINNATQVLHSSVIAANSQEYQDVQYFIWATPTQNGVQFNGVKWNGRFHLQGNIFQNAAPGPYIIGLTRAGLSGPSIVTMHGIVSVEVNGSLGTNPYGIYFGDAGSDMTMQGEGLLRLVQGNTNLATGVQFAWRGFVDAANAGFQAVTTPAVPASTVGVTNNGNDCMVYITGGTVTQVRINTVITGMTPPCSVFLPSGGQISITYSVAPTWLWSSVL